MANEFNIKNGFISQGNSIINGGLTATTISVTTYQNLPTDVYVTGGTYSADSSTIIFTNNTGGTFNVTGITATGGGTFTGGTVSGPTNFINGLTANTISSTTISGGTFYGDGSGLTNIQSQSTPSSNLFNYYNFI